MVVLFLCAILLVVQISGDIATYKVLGQDAIVQVQNA